MGPDSQSKDPRLAGVLDRGTLVIIMLILSLLREESGLAKRIRFMECYLLSEPKIRAYRKHMLRLWLQKGILCFGYQNKD